MQKLLVSALAGALIFPLGAAAGATSPHDGRHDFDWNFGTWTTHIKRLAHPLSGSTTWLSYEGTVAVAPLLGGKANIEEIEADGPGHIELIDVRTYDPGSRQWRATSANSRDGTLEQPGFGTFVNGRGIFYDQEAFEGKAILVRQTFFDVTPVSYAFEQAFSDDGGKTWEPNFVANLHRTSRAAVPNKSPAAAAHDFDFNEGTWTTHIKSLNSAANGDPSWLSLSGTVAIRKIWNGRAYVEELDAPGKNGFAGITLYLYNPQTRQWSQTFADVSDGAFEPPMIGAFDGGRGELIAQDSFGGKIALLRGVWSNITSNAHDFEIDVSKDGGAKWQPVFVAHLTRKVADPPAAERDGRHDFDFEIGDWTILPDGAGHVVRKLWDGATIAQLVIRKPAPHVRGSLLSVYNPSARVWNIYWADAVDGSLSPPLIGRFERGVGTFVGRDTTGGHAVLVRLVVSKITQRSFQTVQAESRDGGTSWQDAKTQTYIRS